MTSFFFSSGQIGMRPPLHCASTFSTCLWFTNFTKIRGSHYFVKYASSSTRILGCQPLLGQNTLPLYHGYQLPTSSSHVFSFHLLIQGAPTLDPELWTYSKQFYYEAGDTSGRPRLKVSNLGFTVLPKLHQKHGCEETDANYLDWQVHFLLLDIRF